MNNGTIEKQEKVLDGGFTQVGLFSLLAAVLRLFEMIVFHDAQANMLMQNAFVTALNWLIFLCVAWVVFCGVRMGIAISAAGPGAADEPKRGKLPPVIGFGLLGLGVFFLVQAALDLAAVLSGSFDFIAWAQLAFCLLSAVTFFRMGYQVSARGNAAGGLLELAPLVWALLTVVRLLIFYSSAISYQSDAERTVVSLLAICFLAAMGRWLGGDAGAYRPAYAVAAALFPGVALAETLPYAALFPFGIRDAVSSTPYFAQLGLALFGFFALLCLAVNAVIRLERRRHRRNG